MVPLFFSARDRKERETRLAQLGQLEVGGEPAKHSAKARTHRVLHMQRVPCASAGAANGEQVLQKPLQKKRVA